MKKREPSSILGGNVNCSTMMENSMKIPQKNKNRSYDPAIPLLGIYAKIEMRTLIQIEMCTPMSIATLFIMTEKWKQSKCPSMDE